MAPAERDPSGSFHYVGPEVAPPPCSPHTYFAATYRPVEMHIYHHIHVHQSITVSLLELSRRLGHNHTVVEKAVKQLVANGLLHRTYHRANQPSTLSVRPAQGAHALNKAHTYILKGKELLEERRGGERKESVEGLQRKKKKCDDVSPHTPKEPPMPKTQSARTTTFTYPPNLPKVKADRLLTYAIKALGLRMLLKTRGNQLALRNAAARLTEGYTEQDLYAVVNETKRRIECGWEDHQQRSLQRIWHSGRFEDLLYERPMPFKKKHFIDRSVADTFWEKEALEIQRRDEEKTRQGIL